MRKSEVPSEGEKVNCGKMMILPAGLKACFLICVISLDFRQHSIMFIFSSKLQSRECRCGKDLSKDEYHTEGSKVFMRK